MSYDGTRLLLDSKGHVVDQTQCFPYDVNCSVDECVVRSVYSLNATTD